MIHCVMVTILMEPAFLRRCDLFECQYTAEITDGVCPMRDIPEIGFVRLPQVLNVIPVGRTCWWEGVKAGRFPRPVKLSPRCTAWRAEDIRELIKSLSDRTPSE